MYVIATAGHVDHGKSTLVKALTGIDPDRWEEEHRREMTIDLGFAWLTLPTGRTVSIVDVPGHERFIKNMLAGMGGIDAALLVIAADESVMPQTEEHLAVLDLLGIEHGIVVLTRTDLVDAEWLALVHEEVADYLAGTSFARAPCVAVSARTGSGLALLRETLDAVLDATPARGGAQGVPRLPIDRSFTISGFGTIVTGTLLDGPLVANGQEVAVLPDGQRARVRGLQSHQQHQEQALPGTRVAVNLSGIHHRDIQRGDMLTLPGTLQPTRLLDVQVRMVQHGGYHLQHNAELDLFIGTAEVRCRAALLNDEVLEPGSTGWVQLRLERAVAAVRGERCILRQPSPGQTIGGGVIVDTHPPRHRRFRPAVVAALETRLRGAPDALLLQELGTTPRLWDDLLQAAGLDAALAHEGLELLRQDGRVLALAGGAVLVSAPGWQQVLQQVSGALQHYHQRFPLRSGMPRQELRQRLKLEARVAHAVLEEATQQGHIGTSETSAWLATHTPTLSTAQQHAVDALLAEMAQQPYAPPPPPLEPDLLALLLERGTLQHISGDVYVLPQTWAALQAWVEAVLDAQGSISLGQVRDHFGTSRKYAVAFLEHLDERKVTRRSGDVRVRY